MSCPGVALFGGSFNPIHHGHLIIARSVAEQVGLRRVVIIPAGYPPNKWPMELAPAPHRLQMARLAVAGDPLFEVSDIDLQQGGLNYAVNAVEAYRASAGPDVPLSWLIGADALADLPTWHRVRELADLCRIVTSVRAGYQMPDLSSLERVLAPHQVARVRESIVATPQIEISATQIRRRIAEGRSIRHLVPEPVREYILDERLYL